MDYSDLTQLWTLCYSREDTFIKIIATILDSASHLERLIQKIEWHFLRRPAIGAFTLLCFILAYLPSSRHRHRWITLCASFSDARTSLTNVQRIVHQRTKYQRIMPSEVVNNVSYVMKKCVDIASWFPDIAGQCSDAKCPEHYVAMRGIFNIDVRILYTDELCLISIWTSVSNVRTLITDVCFSPCTNVR